MLMSPGHWDVLFRKLFVQWTFSELFNHAWCIYFLIIIYFDYLHVLIYLPLFLRNLRPSMLQHLLRRLVFDVPILNEYAKMPLKVWTWLKRSLDKQTFIESKQRNEDSRIKIMYVSSRCYYASSHWSHNVILLAAAFDQSLWALLEVLLPAQRLGQLWSVIRGGAASHP